MELYLSHVDQEEVELKGLEIEEITVDIETPTELGQCKEDEGGIAHGSSDN